MSGNRALSSGTLFALAALFVAAVPARAQDAQPVAPAQAQRDDAAGSEADKAPNIAEKSADMEPGAIATVELASRLFEHAQENEDPIAMIAAARIRQTVPSTEGTLEKEPGPTQTGTTEAPAQDTETAAAAAPAKPDDTQPAPSTAEQMLAAAREAAGDDQAILALIDEASATATRGVVDRRKQIAKYESVDEFATDGYRWRDYQAGEPAEVLINGDDDTDLDLYVYDRNGNLACSSTGYTDEEYCVWYPRRTGPFRIEVVNLGPVYNRYWIETY